MSQRKPLMKCDDTSPAGTYPTSLNDLLRRLANAARAILDGPGLEAHLGQTWTGSTPGTNMERKLVTIQRIDALDPIPGADNIEHAGVMGWNVGAKKGEFAVGDPCVFFEIDSVLPDGPAWSEFMRPRGFRVRTVKLRGVLSQGLALPVSIVGGDAPSREVDLRDRLGVTRFEAVVPDTREIAGPFPARVPRTDEIGLQSALGVLDEIRGQAFYVSTKCDGTSATFVRDSEAGFVAASR